MKKGVSYMKRTNMMWLVALMALTMATSCQSTGKGEQAAQVNDSIFSSPDLKAFFLSGPVKEMIEIGEYTSDTTRFSDKGELLSRTRYDDPDFHYEFTHNELGQLTDLIAKDCWEGGDAGETFEYNDDGYPSSYSDWMSDTYTEVYKEYDDHHFPTLAERDDESKGTKITFKYDGIDKYGNWTIKTATSHYPEDFDIDDETVVTKRVIEYYE